MSYTSTTLSFLILDKLLDKNFTVNSSLLKFKEYVTKAIGNDISSASKEVLLSTIDMLLVNLSIDPHILLAESDQAALLTPRSEGPTSPREPIDGVMLNNAPTYPTTAKPSIGQRFWMLSMNLFLNVCHPHSQCRDSINIIEDIVRLLDSADCKHKSPALILAADVVVQRAIYELSDKVPQKSLDSSGGVSSPQNTPREGNPPNNIERCVSIMSQEFLPFCSRLQKSFGIPNSNNDSPVQLGSRVQTLNRQLQELLAWTKYEGQHRVSPLFEPPYSTAVPHNNANSSVTSSDNTPRSGHVASLLVPENMLSIMDDVLLSVVHECTMPDFNLANAQIDTACRKIHQLLTSQGNFQVDVMQTGALAMGLPPLTEQGPELDLIAIIPNYYYQNNPKLSSEKRQSLLSTSKSYESLVDMETAFEACLKHMKACFKELINAVNVFIENTQSIIPSIQDSYSPFHGHNITRTLTLLREEAEALLALGDEVLNIQTQLKINKLSSCPALSIVIAKLDELNETIEKPDKERSSMVKKFAKAWEKPLRDAGYQSIRCITNKTRFFHVKFVGMYPGIRQPVHSTLFVDTVVPYYASRLLSCCISYHPKLSAYFQCIRLYVKAHKVAEANSGFLSMYAWYMLALHVLLRHDYVPNVHIPVYNQMSSLLERDDIIDIFSSVPSTLPAQYQQKLQSVSLLELLDRFFRYYVEEHDIFHNTITLRDSGKAVNKTEAQLKGTVFWRLSIEDPFESEYSTGSYDLGSSLSRSGQLTTFKALRRGAYGVFAIATQGIESCRANIKKLFSRSELIHLARKAEYMGAMVLTPLPYVRSIYSPFYLTLDHMTRPPEPDKLALLESIQSDNAANSSLRSVVVAPPGLPFRNTTVDSIPYSSNSSSTSGHSQPNAFTHTTPTGYLQRKVYNNSSNSNISTSNLTNALRTPYEYSNPNQNVPLSISTSLYANNNADSYSNAVNTPNYNTSPYHTVNAVSESMLLSSTSNPNPTGGAKVRPFVPPIPLHHLNNNSQSQSVDYNSNYSGGYYVGNNSARSVSGQTNSSRYYASSSPLNTSRTEDNSGMRSNRGHYSPNNSSHGNTNMYSPRDPLGGSNHGQDYYPFPANPNPNPNPSTNPNPYSSHANALGIRGSSSNSVQALYQNPAGLGSVYDQPSLSPRYNVPPTTAAQFHTNGPYNPSLYTQHYGSASNVLVPPPPPLGFTSSSVTSSPLPYSASSQVSSLNTSQHGLGTREGGREIQ